MNNHFSITNCATVFIVTAMSASIAFGDLKDIRLPESLARCTAQAEAGDVNAQLSLFKYYLLHSETDKAMEWLREAAKQGNDDAEYTFGAFRVKQDPEEAIVYLRRAAEKGNAGAQYCLGRFCYFDGAGVEKDEAKGLEWIRKSAAQGFNEAQAFIDVHELSKGNDDAPAATFNGLFGVKFGTIISQSKKCETNNTYSLAYEYTPEKKFNEFSDYVIFASPKTRTVYQIRGVYSCGDKYAAKEKIDEVVSILEAKFGHNARKLGDDRIIRFPNGDTIHVTLQSNWLRSVVFIDAVNDKFSELDGEESKQVKAEIFRADIAALQILPNVEDGENVKKITGLFGKSFGDIFPENEYGSRNDNGALIYDIEADKEFLGFSLYKAFATPESREIFMFRAVYTEGDDSEVVDKVVSLLEQVLGKEAETSDDGDKYFVVNGLKSKCLITITTQDDMIFLDVTDVSQYAKAQEQEKARKRKRYSSEFDAL